MASQRGVVAWRGSLTGMSELVVGAVQMTSTEDVEANLERAAGAGPAGGDVPARCWSGLPENFAYLGNDRDHRLAIAETLPDPGTPPDAPRQGRRPDPRRDAGAGPRGRDLAPPGRLPRTGRRQQDPQQRRAARPFGGGGLRLSEDPPLRRRRPGRQALPRVRGHRARGRAGGGRDPLGRPRAQHLLRPPLPRALPGAGGGRRADRGGPLGVHAWRPGRITGTSCSAPGPSRTRSS